MSSYSDLSESYIISQFGEVYLKFGEKLKWHEIENENDDCKFPTVFLKWYITWTSREEK